MRLDALVKRAAQYRTPLLAISGLTLLSSGSMLAIPWLAGQLLGGVLADGQGALLQIASLLVAALAATTIFGMAAAMLSAHTAGRVLADLRLEAYAHVQRLPAAFHDRSNQGDLLALMTYEVTSLSQFLTSSLASVPAMLLTAAGSVVLLFLLDPQVALVVPLLLPVFFVALKLIGRKQRLLAADAREADAEMMMLAEQDLEILPAIKAFAVEDRLRERYRLVTQRSFGLVFQQAKISALIGPGIALAAGLAAIALLLGTGAAQPDTPRSAAELFALLMYAALLTRPVGSLADFYGRLQWARGTLARLDSVLAITPEAGPEIGTPIARARGAVAFEGVDFGYPGRDRLLRGLSLRIEAGEIVALTGHNGAGKSTLINLLLRFYIPESGTITLDGQDIAGISLPDLRRQIGLVPQRALLFNGTLRENIAFGLPGASEAQMLNALRLAQAEEFIAELPQGLETEIGDSGVRLSGGQRQRVALARALLPDPPILVFDEATAMYDLESEAAFVAACQTALKGRTVIIVTHRPASLALADRIIVIESGVAQLCRPVAALEAP